MLSAERESGKHRRTHHALVHLTEQAPHLRLRLQAQVPPVLHPDQIQVTSRHPVCSNACEMRGVGWTWVKKRVLVWPVALLGTVPVR